MTLLIPGHAPQLIQAQRGRLSLAGGAAVFWQLGMQKLWLCKALGAQRREREREREEQRQQHRTFIYHKSDFPVNKVTLCKQLNFSQLSCH